MGFWGPALVRRADPREALKSPQQWFPTLPWAQRASVFNWGGGFRLKLSAAVCKHPPRLPSATSASRPHRASHKLPGLAPGPAGLPRSWQPPQGALPAASPFCQGLRSSSYLCSPLVPHAQGCCRGPGSETCGGTKEVWGDGKSRGMGTLWGTQASQGLGTGWLRVPSLAPGGPSGLPFLI